MKAVKALLSLAVAASAACVPLLGGCLGTGKDGRDGQDVSIHEIYEETNAARRQEGLEELTFLQFVEEYLGYTSEEAEQIASLQTTVNRSLLSAVSILCSFDVRSGMTVEQASFAGAGVILDVDKQSGDMLVVTNCHVVYQSAAMGDKFCDDIGLWLYGDEYLESKRINAEIIAAAQTYDIALLKVEGSAVVKASQAVAAEWSTEEEAYLGESVYAVGNPEGAGMSVTTGVVSKDSENISIDMEDTRSEADDYTYRVLRTDAAINGGNSGGGLFNTEGKLVGIVNAKGVSEEIDNMGYALPAATTRRLVNNMLANDKGVETHGVRRALLGVTSQVTDRTATYDNARNVVNIVEEVYVIEVQKNSAAHGKVEAGDIVKHITVKDGAGNIKENLPVLRQHNLSDAMLSVCEGDTVLLTVERFGERVELEMYYGAGSIGLEKGNA